MEDNAAAATVFLEALIARAFANGSQKTAKRAKDLASWLMPPSIPARSQQRKDGDCEGGIDWDRSALRELAETGAVATGGRASGSNADCSEKREVEEEGREAEAALRAVETEVGAIEHLVLLGQLAGASSSSGDGGRGEGGAESMLSRIGAARRAVLCVWRELQQTGAEE
ncbi:hypothetical protein GGF42_008196, partial [Coemansia sp. RSA 2424]